MGVVEGLMEESGEEVAGSIKESVVLLQSPCTTPSLRSASFRVSSAVPLSPLRFGFA